MGRAPCCEKVGLKKGRWTPEEDELLSKYIQANGEGSWRSLPKKAGLLRCGKSCRLRWINYLRSDLKRGNITPEEEELIVKLHNAFGNRWSLIASHLPGRTDNEIKNYWNSHLSRKMYCFTKLCTDPKPTTVNSVQIGGPCKRRRGRVSRSAMKKNKFNFQSVDGDSLKTSKEKEESDVLQAYEWLDNEIMGLINSLQSEAPNISNAEQKGYGISDTTEGGNGLMGMVSEEVTRSEDRNFCTLHAETDTEERFILSPSMNPSIDDLWMKWVCTDSDELFGQDNFDGGDEKFSWLWND